MYSNVHSSQPFIQLFHLCTHHLFIQGEIQVNDNEDDNDESPPAAHSPQDEEEEEEEAPSDPAEDLQIAWENLETARSIMSKMVEEFSKEEEDAIVIKSVGKSEEVDGDNSNVNNNDEKKMMTYTKDQQTEILLDLAKVHSRLGDLQKANGNSTGSISDYIISLSIRSKCLDRYDKLVADAHFSLAQAYVEAPNSQARMEDEAAGIVAALGGGEESGSGGHRELTEEELAEFREKSCDHYLACGVSFAGLLAKMCGVDADEITKVEDASLNSGGRGAAAAATASTASSVGVHSETLAILRKRISTLQPLASTDNDTFTDICEMLDEIQEALDSAEGTEQALKGLAVMKANEIRKHSGKGGEGETVLEEGGATTTIGFGNVASSCAASSASGTTIGFGSGSGAAASSSATAAPTMMVVKKKKKKPQSAEEDASAKRAKTK